VIGGLSHGPLRASGGALLTLLRPARFASLLALSLSLLLFLFRAAGFSLPALALAPLMVALAGIVVLDLAARTIPNVVTLPMLVYALSLAWLEQGTITPGQAALGMVVGGSVPLILATIGRGAIGGGDVKLMAGLGAALGWKGALYVFALSHVGGALVILGLSLVRRRGPRERFPIGALIALVGALWIAAWR